ncbi:hypothetical protein C0Q70_00930 [Pomacea canaliculata]|uniref:Innexin n=1 Tax=Pomacea canaliculata TaxID=400727 RepID=A0A2T7PY32_POMCA|nr:hypothetical protein C0Q70_00930 [Pomacea canaliculata]
MMHSRHAHHPSKSHHTRSHQKSRTRHLRTARHRRALGRHHRHDNHNYSDHEGSGESGRDDANTGKYEELTGSAIHGEGLDSVLGSFATYARLKGRYDDDWIDRLNHLYTTIILIIFTIVVSTKQYVGEPIHCWCPAQFEESQVEYTNNVCWISNTYHVPFEDIPPRHTRPHETEIGYYQWVPMILLFQALLFKVPCILWRILTASAGVNLDKIVTLAAETAYVAPDERDRTIKHIVRYMDRWIENAREYRSGCFIRIRQQISKYCCLVWGKRYGNYLVTLYIAANFLIWVYTMIFRQHRLRYLKKFLRINDCYKSELDKKMAVKFAEQYLRQDGIFVLRLVGKNANDVLVSELILQLWNHYRNKPLFRHANQISDDNSNV